VKPEAEYKRRAWVRSGSKPRPAPSTAAAGWSWPARKATSSASVTVASRDDVPGRERGMRALPSALRGTRDRRHQQHRGECHWRGLGCQRLHDPGPGGRARSPPRVPTGATGASRSPRSTW